MDYSILKGDRITGTISGVSEIISISIMVDTKLIFQVDKNMGG